MKEMSGNLGKKNGQDLGQPEDSWAPDVPKFGTPKAYMNFRVVFQHKTPMLGCTGKTLQDSLELWKSRHVCHLFRKEFVIMESVHI